MSTSEPGRSDEPDGLTAAGQAGRAVVSSTALILYAATVFIGAFQLFLLQPVIAKQILPWFGGSAAVWTTCLVFFQGLLFAGYAYSHWLTGRLPAGQQAALHLILLSASLLFLPIIPVSSWKPTGTEDPVALILGLLMDTVGLPYFLLASTGPLMQAWFARAFPAAPVYRLFALSNFASLLALLIYPILIEPWLPTHQQSVLWSCLYVVFALLSGAIVLAARHPGAAVGPADAGRRPLPGPRRQSAWLLLSAMGTATLVAMTNRLTQDLASVPFLWILPLALYLITFILCFEGRGWYRRGSFVWLLLAVVAALAWKLNETSLSAAVAIPLHLAGLFVMCMFFHGELAERKPAPEHLTRFYLLVSLGGVLGGAAVAIGAVRLFNANYEFGLGLVATLLVAAYAVDRWHPLALLAALAATGITGYYVVQQMEVFYGDTRMLARNFYGTLRVKEVDPDDPVTGRRRLLHGVTIHGEQYRAAYRHREPTTYYGPTSGIGRTLKDLEPASRVGIVGLGTGTLAAYGRPGDTYRFYEINPQVIQMAGREFGFLAESGAQIELVSGDARLAMEREPPQRYDVLAIDAFSSDAIPVHLMTCEALGIYLKHLKPEGVIAFHVSNRYLRLAPVVKALADAQGLTAVLVQDSPRAALLMRSDWVLVARDKKSLERSGIAQAGAPIETIPGLAAWTDQFNNLLRILK